MRYRAPEPATADRRRERRPQRVLVVDDNDAIRELWHTYLTLSGFAVTEAVNGVDAIERVVQAVPAAIIIDFSMPVMNGADAVRTLRHHPWTATTPVIGLTGHGADPSTREFRRVCDTVLEKPIEAEALLDALRDLLRRGLRRRSECPEV